ncbi:MAG: M20 family metallo-hydrolase [SAR202 cluster bacterium]|nr:M20 family metallo-hydrolase [SAR202 cluster bacterium]|tara:strand:+ start:2042 stop:3307 length:1266 start_codon:yes stop_codon:yes gene_type:complete
MGNISAAVSKKRLEDDFNKIQEFTDPLLPYTRRAFSPQYYEARKWLAQKFTDAGLQIRVDPVGNLIGRLGTLDGPSLSMGSHIDTVEAGGRFDGIVGVLAALEVVRCLGETGTKLSFPLEIIDFVCEEPTIVNLSPLGSRVMSGDVTADMVKMAVTPFGDSLSDAIKKLGGNSDRIPEVRREPGNILGYLELHIEQGPVLEKAGLDIGVVTVVAAPCRAVVSLVGVADHAGATSMSDRRDALAGAAELTLAVEKIVSSPDIVQESVGTVGSLTVSPNMVNIIPGRVDMTVEVRSTVPEALIWAREEIESSLNNLALRRGLEAKIEWLQIEEPVTVPFEMQSIIAEAADEIGISVMHLPSRASHDAAKLAPIAPVGMIFIPCLEGRSHCPEEWADIDDIVTGAKALGQSLLKLDEHFSTKVN